MKNLKSKIFINLYRARVNIGRVPKLLVTSRGLVVSSKKSTETPNPLPHTPVLE